MHEAQFGIVPASRDPAEHPAPVAVEPVPHDFPDEPADLQEAIHPVELGGTDGNLVTAALAHKVAVAPAVVRLSAASSHARLGLHALHERFEVTRRQLEIEVQLAEVVELPGVDGVEAGVEGFDHTRAHASPTSILASDGANEIETCCILCQDDRRRIGRPVVDNHPQSGANALPDDRVQGSARECRFVAARRDKDVPSSSCRGAHRGSFNLRCRSEKCYPQTPRGGRLRPQPCGPFPAVRAGMTKQRAMTQRRARNSDAEAHDRTLAGCSDLRENGRAADGRLRVPNTRVKCPESRGRRTRPVVRIRRPLPPSARSP